MLFLNSFEFSFSQLLGNDTISQLSGLGELNNWNSKLKHYSRYIKFHYIFFNWTEQLHVFLKAIQNY